MTDLTREEFYDLRDDRTRRLAGHMDFGSQPVRVLVDDEAAESLSGQLLSAALINLLARFARTIHVTIRNVKCRIPGCGEDFIYEHLDALAHAIDPFVCVRRGRSTEVAFTIGIGTTRSTPANVYLCGDGWLARCETAAFEHSWSSSINPVGPLISACLGASEAFKVVTGEGAPLRGASLLVPELLGSDEFEAIGEDPLDVGNVLQVGAGAVGSAFAYALGLLTLRGSLRLVDADVVKIHNLNRSPLFLFSHAEVPGRQQGTLKAEVVANHLTRAGLDVTVDNAWYDQVFAKKRPTGFDLWLPLANERGVRRSMQLALPPLMLHATTTPSWGVNVHRHLATTDDCLMCRIREDDPQSPALACATGTIGSTGGTQIDAALPFQSTAAGVLLAASVILLANGHSALPDNFLEINFRHSAVLPQTLRRKCLPTCQSSSITRLSAEYNKRTRYQG